MRRIATRFGIGLSVFAFVALMIFIVLPAVIPFDSLPVVKNVVQALFCKSGETLTASYSTYETPGTTTKSTALECVNSEGQGRNVGDNFITTAFIGYLVTFLGGIGIVGIAQYFPSRSAGPAPSPAQSFHENDSLEGHDHTNRHEAGSVSRGTSAHESLALRLTELKTALDAGLITQAEYDVKRKEILKEA